MDSDFCQAANNWPQEIAEEQSEHNREKEGTHKIHRVKNGQKKQAGSRDRASIEGPLEQVVDSHPRSHDGFSVALSLSYIRVGMIGFF